MKVCIVTLYGQFNYGNRLQNYALQTVLQQFGCDVVSVAAVKKEGNIKYLIKKYFEKNNGRIRLKKRKDILRERRFSEFTDRNIITELYHTTDGRIPEKVGSEYDRFIVGSDQVWNPIFWRDDEYSPEMYNYFLMFTTRKKASYAASFGLDSIPSNWEERFEKNILGIDLISVREMSGKNIVSKLGLDSELVLDPTLLLDAKQWKQIKSDFVPKDKKYDLLYFLGDKPPSLPMDPNIEVIDLMNSKCRYFTCGPETFLELIDNARTVYTDSFHATVFSLVFHTPFIIYGRTIRGGTGMNSRILSLLDAFGIDTRDFSEGVKVSSFDDDKIIIQKQKSFEFIRKILD